MVPPRRLGWSGELPAEFDVEDADGPVEGVFDDLGFGVSGDEVAFAFVGQAAVGAEFGEGDVGEEVSDFALDFFPAVDGADPATVALAAEVAAAGGVLAGGGIELFVDEESGPGAEGVEVGGAGDDAGELGAWGTGGDFGDGEGAVGASEPLGVAHAGIHAEDAVCFEGGGADVVELRGIDFAGEDDDPLHPRVAHDLEAGRVVAIDGVEQAFAAEPEGVAAAFAAGEELFGDDLVVGGGVEDVEGVAEGVVVVDLEGLLGGGAVEGFDHEGEAGFGGEVPGVVFGADAAVSGAGDAGVAEEVLHAGLVAEVAGGFRGHAVESEFGAEFGADGLEVFDRAEELVDGSEACGESVDGPAELVEVAAFGDPPVAGEGPAQVGRQAFLGVVGDGGDLDVGEGGDGLEDAAIVFVEERERGDHQFHGVLHPDSGGAGA